MSLAHTDTKAKPAIPVINLKCFSFVCEIRVIEYVNKIVMKKYHTQMMHDSVSTLPVRHWRVNTEGRVSDRSTRAKGSKYQMRFILLAI